MLSSCAKIKPELRKLQKTVKIGKKIIKNSCFFYKFLNIPQFGLSISTKTLQSGLQFGLPHF